MIGDRARRALIDAEKRRKAREQFKTTARTLQQLKKSARATSDNEPLSSQLLVRQALIDKVAELLREETNAQSLSQRALGRLMGDSTNRSVNRVLQGYDIKLSTLADFASALGKQVKIELVDKQKER